MRIPIVFAFDKNLSFPAAVCVSSLMNSADKDTHYDIYVLYGGDVVPRIYGEEKLLSSYSNLSINYRSVGHAFEGAYEIRGITTPTYYRLLIPELFPEFDKVLYADVDIVFRTDCAALYNTELGDNYLGAVYALEKCLSEQGRGYTESIGLTPGEYYQAGVLLMNLDAMRKDGLTERFISLVPRKYKFQDQDILNIVCEGRIHSLPWRYNMGTTSFIDLEKDQSILTAKYANCDFSLARDHNIIHFNGVKPWKDYCLNFDIWWESYRQSPIYDSHYYFSFYYNKLNYLDQLTLSKRIKLLVRYFLHGKMHAE